MSQLRICNRCNKQKLTIDFGLQWDKYRKIWYYKGACASCLAVAEKKRRDTPLNRKKQKTKKEALVEEQQKLSNMSTEQLIDITPDYLWQTVTIPNSPLRPGGHPLRCRDCGQPIEHAVEDDVLKVYLKHIKINLVRLYPETGTVRYCNTFYCNDCHTTRRPLVSQREYLPETWPIDELLELERYSRVLHGMNSGSLYDPIAQGTDGEI